MKIHGHDAALTEAEPRIEPMVFAFAAHGLVVSFTTTIITGCTTIVDRRSQAGPTKTTHMLRLKLAIIQQETIISSFSKTSRCWYIVN